MCSDWPAVRMLCDLLVGPNAPDGLSAKVVSTLKVLQEMCSKMASLPIYYHAFSLA